MRPITLAAPGVFAQDARPTFAFHPDGGAALSGRETIEVATADGRASTTIVAGKGYDVRDARTGIVSVQPAEALGPVAFGALRFRVVADGEASTWVPLATIARLPEIRSVACASARTRRITGNRLFLIDKVGMSAAFQQGQDIPDGFVGTEVTASPGADGRILLWLRDAPKAVASIAA